MSEKLQQLETLYEQSKSATFLQKAKLAEEAVQLNIAIVRELTERVQQLEDQLRGK